MRCPPTPTPVLLDKSPWTFDIWPMACLPVINLKIASHKSQAKISTEQSAHSMCPLRSSVCLTRGLQFGIANWKILADCHYSISEGILDRKKGHLLSTINLSILYLKFGGFILSWCTIFLLCHVSVAKRWNEFPLPMAGLYYICI